MIACGSTSRGWRDVQVGMLQHTAECALAVTLLQLKKGASESKSPEVRLYALLWLLQSRVLLLDALVREFVTDAPAEFLPPNSLQVCRWLQAYEHLQRSLLPVLHQFEGLDEGPNQAKARDWSSLQMLARRTKNQLVLD